MELRRALCSLLAALSAAASEVAIPTCHSGGGGEERVEITGPSLLQVGSRKQQQPSEQAGATSSGEDATKSNRGNFSQSCKLYPEKRVVLVTVNTDYLDMFRNWLHYAREFLGETEQLHVIAEDAGAVAPLKEIQQTFDFALTEPGKATSLVQLPFGSKGYHDVVWRRPSHILRFLREGCTVLYVDIDSVWVKDPFHDIGEAGEADIYLPADDEESQFGHTDLCTCFLYVQPTARAQRLMQDWAGQQELHPHIGNQIPFNAVISRASHDSGRKHRPLKKVVLPVSKFPPGKLADVHSGSVATVLHANWMVSRKNKVKFFQRFGLWSMGDAPASADATPSQDHLAEAAAPAKALSGEEHLDLTGLVQTLSGKEPVDLAGLQRALCGEAHLDLAVIAQAFSDAGLHLDLAAIAKQVLSGGEDVDLAGVVQKLCKEEHLDMVGIARVASEAGLDLDLTDVAQALGQEHLD